MTELATPPVEQLAQDRRTAEDAARTCNRRFREVFQTWLNLGKV